MAQNLADGINKFTARTTQIAGVLNALGVLGKNKKNPPTKRGMAGVKAQLDRVAGPQRTNLFVVEISPPQMLNNFIDASKTLTFLTESCNLPGVSLATSEIKRHGYGVAEKKPYLPIFTDQSFSVIADNKGVAHRFFYKWLNGIVQYDSPFGDASNYAGLRPFQVNYKDNYKSNVTITTYDEFERKVIVVQLYEAFPIFLGDMAFNWSDIDGIARMPITFTYLNWARTNIDIETVDKLGNNNLSLLQRLQKAGNAIQTLASIRKPRNVADIVNVVNNAKIALPSF